MNATSPDPVLERPWLTYTKALLFILPAIIAWSFACVRLMPMAKEICDKAGFDPSQLGHSGWIWPATFLLADWSRTILVAAVLAFVLVEFVAPRWWHHRLVLGIGLWVANLAVLFALSVLLAIVLLAAPGLAYTR
jgi:hypothetical protein